MGDAAMRRTACLGFVLAAWLVLGTPAAAQTVPLPDADATVSDVVDTVSSTTDQVVATAQDTIDQATSSGGSGSSGGGDVVSSTTAAGGSIAGSVFSTVAGTTSTASSGGSTTSSSSGSGGGGSTASTRSGSNGGRAGSSRQGPRTRFDRLPRRFETLLERIELGRNVRANIRRLERALASASPELRRRVLRQLRAEIARLRKGGVTRPEQRRIERLRLTFEALTDRQAPGASPSPTTTSSAGNPSGALSAAPALPGVQLGAQLPQSPAPGTENTGVLGAQTGGGVEEPALRPIPLPPAPDQSDGFPVVIGLALLALLVLGFVGVVAGVTSHVFGRARSG
jgi:hypothetical protein